MPSDSLNDWLARLERLDPHRIELGLERVGRVARAMGVDRLPCKVVTVAGTNGKGSTVALLEAVYVAAGHRVGAYTSPHLVRYNERVRVDGREVTDAALCDAFERVEAARGTTPLTYFEFGTLAALDFFARAGLDVALLEVGLGGRLDAVNIVDSDVAVITPIAVDHVAWLGADREAIGLEKAGVLRHGRPAVCSDPAPPASLLERAAELCCELAVLGRDFTADIVSGARAGDGRWTWSGPRGQYRGLPVPGLPGRHQYGNAAGALMALECLGADLAVDEPVLRHGLSEVALPGRCQLLPGEVPCVLDVAHNEEGVRSLADYLCSDRQPGRTHAVAAVLGDKDIDAMVAALSDIVDGWYIAGLEIGRAAPVARLYTAIAAQVTARTPVRVCRDIAEAFHQARAAARPGDRIVVFGSFYTVGEVLGLRRHSAA